MEPTVFRFCDACNDDRNYNRVVRRETVVIRGVARVIMIRKGGANPRVAVLTA